MTTLTDVSLLQNKPATCASKTLNKFTLPSSACDNIETTNVPDTPAVRLAKSIEALKRGFFCDRNFVNKVDGGNQTDVRSGRETESDAEICGNTSLALLPENLPAVVAFPYLTDDFLEKLGLDEGSPELQLSKEDTEKIFKSLTLQMNLNMEDIMERLKQHKYECEKQHKRCFYLIRDISTRLRDHKCIGATDPINPVFVLLEDVRFMLQEIIKSNGLLGIIMCEKRMAKCWRLIFDHVQSIRSEINSKNIITEEKQSQTEHHECENDKPVECPKNCGKNIEDKGSRKSTYYACIMVLTLLAFGLLAVHLRCYYALDYESCLMNNFVEVQQTGDPPY